MGLNHKTNCAINLLVFYTPTVVKTYKELYNLKMCNMQFQGDSRFGYGIQEICENHSVPRHFLTILAGLYYVTLLRPISIRAISLQQAQHLYGRLHYFGSIKNLI